MKNKLRIFRIILQVIFFILFLPLLPVIISGKWNWWQAWMYASVYILGFGVSRWLARRRSPDILTERPGWRRKKTPNHGIKSWSYWWGSAGV